ncbi:glycosyltransferase [Alkanindiges sp. WGS2144]|uniref:glycosyltransferase n=1 Tax=Alkanindiges sp. WGS2144 TaxID=3366808 RepID=UPI003752E8DB
MARISIVMAGDEEGGLEKHVIELCNGLAAKGEQVSLIAHSKYENRLEKQVTFYPVDLSRGRRNPLVLWQLYQAIKQSRPDVIHAHANKAVSMVAPLLKWLKIPSVATLHNKKNKLDAFKQFDRIITVSQRVAAQFDQQEKVRIVLNGVSIANSPHRFIKNHTEKNPVQALAVGRLVAAKGFDILIQAWQGIDATLKIVGDGPDSNALQAQICSLGLENSIELLGYRQDIPELLAQSDVFIISSRNEGGPYTLAEALLMQTPVLSTDVGMVAEVLPNILICKPNDVSALHKLLKQYLLDLRHLNTLSQPVYQFAQGHLTFDAMLGKTIAVYQELVPNRQEQRL